MQCFVACTRFVVFVARVCHPPALELASFPGPFNFLYGVWERVYSTAAPDVCRDGQYIDIIVIVILTVHGNRIVVVLQLLSYRFRIISGTFISNRHTLTEF